MLTTRFWNTQYQKIGKPNHLKVFRDLLQCAKHISVINFIRYTQSQKIGRGRHRIVVGFTTTYAIGAYHHWCEFESRSGRGEQHYVIKFVSDLQQVMFSLGTPVSSTNKADHHEITEILLKVVLSTIKPKPNQKIAKLKD